MPDKIYQMHTTDKNTDKNDEVFEESLVIPRILNSTFTGGIADLKTNYSKTLFQTNQDMIYDSEKMIHSGFIYSAADWAATIAVNQPYSVTIGAKINFFAPAKAGDVIEFEAHAYFDESRKRDVKVVGKINDVKIFEGTFQIVILEEHIFKLQKRSKENISIDTKSTQST